jgi:hypothetical protein
MRRAGLLSTFYVFSFPFLLAACSAPGGASPKAAALAAPKTSAAAHAPAVLAEGECANPKLRIQVTEVARSGPESVTVKFRLLNPDRSAPVTIGNAFAEGTDAGWLSAVFLLDASGQKKAFVLRDDRGEPQSSAALGQLPPGGQADAWARYPMPAPGATRLTVQVPGVPPFRDLPVADAPSGTGPAGPSY